MSAPKTLSSLRVTMASGRCSDDEYPWEREGEHTKYPYVVHAELNAILNAAAILTRRADLCRLIPCNECAKAIIQSGIREVIYLSDKYAKRPLR